MSHRALSGAALVFALLLPVAAARAADTVETWAPGATNLDFYVSSDGLGTGRDGRILGAEVLLGYGIVDRFSAYLGAAQRGKMTFEAGEAEIHLGVFGTPLDTDHVDLDLFLNVSGRGAGFAAFGVEPSLELNVDLDPDMSSFGFYLRVGLPLFGHDDTPHDLPAFDITLNPGVYWTVAEGHQLLVEYDMAFCPRHDARTVDVGSLALGYNVALGDRVELIAQLAIDLPQAGETAAFGAMVGFIATLPPAP